MVRLVLAVMMLAAAFDLGGLEPQRRSKLVDRIVAVVDDEPILWSDLQRSILARSATTESTLAEWASRDDAERAAIERETLDLLIDQVIRAREVERHDLGPIPAADVEAQMTTLRVSGADVPDEAAVRRLLERQLKVMQFVEQRLAPRIFVDSEEVREYYDQSLAADLARSGESVSVDTDLPAYKDVSAAIRTLLHQRKLDREIEEWTRRLRDEAKVVDLLARPEQPVAPVIQRWDSTSEGGA